MNVRRPHLDRPVALRLAATEYDRCAAVMRDLSPRQWSAPTECPGWDVRSMAAHMLGMQDMAASVRETRRQQKTALRGGRFDIDLLTALQVDEHADWSGARIAERFAARGPKAVRGRKMAPGFVRRRSMGAPQQINGMPDDWSLGYLLDVILTRDPWMHRMDIARAIDTTPELTAEHDAVLVADVVEEWAARHGRPFHLHLTGPAGGTWERGSGGAEIDMDAVEFCRLLSGRGEPSERVGLLGTEVPF